MAGAGLWVASGGVWKRKGRPDRTGDVFTVGTTRPTKSNTGPDPALGTPDPWTGSGSGTEFVISSPGTYEGIDFGVTNTRVRVTASDVIFNHCKFRCNWRATWTEGGYDSVVDFRGGTGLGGRRMYRCSVDNVHQWSPIVSGVMGYGFTMERCWVENFSDGIGIYVPSSMVNGNLDVEMLGCYLGPLGWWWSSAGGVVHSSDTKSHCDTLQWQGGQGFRIEGCDIVGHYSLTLGTGTPNSGNNTAGNGASLAPYTQATAESQRIAIVGGLTSGMGGSLAALMLTPVSSRGFKLECDIVDNWGSGGAFWLNVASASINGDRNPSMIVTGNKITTDQRDGVVLGIDSELTATVSGNYDIDTLAPINRGD